MPKLVIEVLVVVEDEAADGLLDQLAAGKIEQPGGGQVGLLDQALCAHCAVTHRGQIVKIEVARALHRARRLRDATPRFASPAQSAAPADHAASVALLLVMAQQTVRVTGQIVARAPPPLAVAGRP